MFAINELPSGTWTFAVETKPDALRTSARSMAVACASRFPFPIIVSDFGKRPPYDTGDRIVAHDDHRARRNLGPLIERLDGKVGLHVLRTG